MQENIFSVSEIISHIKNLLENNIPPLFIRGEVANFTKHASGHMYFTLKDADARLRCVFFKQNQYRSALHFLPEEGQELIVYGHLSVYARTGSYQLMVSRLDLAGMGIMRMQFEALKEKLHKEGLFLAEHKKSLPPFPQKIGVITSATGAAFQDITNVLARRWPCQVVFAPALVQGEAAPAQIIASLTQLQKTDVDVIIVGRGGGSQEDLFCWNNEDLARAIFLCPRPIISAVGHEIDFCIADFVADLRAATPSAAAELATPNQADIYGQLDNFKSHTAALVQNHYTRATSIFTTYEKALLQAHPHHKLLLFQQKLQEKISHLQTITYLIRDKREKYQLLVTKLAQLSPCKIFKRGYAIVKKENKIIKSRHDLKKNDLIKIQLADGNADCKVLSTEGD